MVESLFGVGIPSGAEAQFILLLSVRAEARTLQSSDLRGDFLKLSLPVESQ